MSSTVDPPGRQIAATQDLRGSVAPANRVRRSVVFGLATLPILPVVSGCGGRLADGTSTLSETPGTESAKGASETGQLRHAGALISNADIARIRGHIAAGERPWLDWWNRLGSERAVDLGLVPNPQAGVYRATNAGTMYWDIQRAWCLALRWKLSGDTRYADKAVETLDAWSATLTEVWTKPAGSGAPEDWTGWLLAGMQGHQWAQVGELMRDYEGWAPQRLARFQDMLVRVFVPHSVIWLNDVTEKWLHLEAHANWDLAALCGVMAIGIFCDRHDLYMLAYNYYTANGRGEYRRMFGNGASLHNVYFMHPGHLGQWQESGRDQGHATLGMSLCGALLEMAWNQGDDLYGLHNNRFLAGAEYVARSNLKDAQGNAYAMPFAVQREPNGGAFWTHVNQSFLNYRGCWEPIYNHYVNRMGLAAPNVARMLALCEQNHWSGNGDDMVYPTLTHRRAAYAGPMKAPSGLSVIGIDGRAVLSWWGSAGATSYRVQRGQAAPGPFAEIGEVPAGEATTFTDAPPGGTWFYRVVAVAADRPGAAPASAAARIALPGELRYALALNDGTGAAASGWLVDGAGRRVRLDAPLMAGATWAEGRVGGSKSVAFDGRSSHIELPAGLFEELSDFTISVWVHANVLRYDTCLLFVGQDGIAHMRLVPKGGNFRYSICASGYADERTVQAPQPLPGGRWVHVAVTQQGTTARLYQDGALVGTQESIQLSPHQLGDQIRLLGWSPVNSAFDGRMQDFRIYSNALTAKEIASLAA